LLTGPVSAVTADVPEHAIRALFVKHSLSLIAVVDEDHRVVGVVREADLIHRGFASADVVESAADLMAPAFSIPEDMPIRSALLQMATSRLRHAPVVAAGGELLGTLIDVVGLRWLRGARS
jgi:CBS domain-containing protein